MRANQLISAGSSAIVGAITGMPGWSAAPHESTARSIHSARSSRVIAQS